MSHETRAQLVELGLSPTEAQVYLALVQNASLGAAAIAAATGLSRTSVYQIVCSLADKGLVESSAGYGSKCVVVPPDHGLPVLVGREEEALAQRKQLAARLGQQLKALAEPTDVAPNELVQVIRSPQLIAERFARLQLEAERQVDAIIKAPVILPRNKENPAQEKAQRRGVQFRGLYERAALEHPDVQPYLESWIKGGEKARVYDGELPHKLVIFDRQTVILPLMKVGDQTPTLVVRNERLGESLSMLFDFLWERAKPFTPEPAKKLVQPAVKQVRERMRNGSRSTRITAELQSARAHKS